MAMVSCSNKRHSRNAEQLEAKTKSLATQAASARSKADEAELRADNPKTDAGSAKSVASNARQVVMVSKSAQVTGEQIGVQADKIYQSMQSADAAKNLYGSDGLQSSSSYQSGTIFKVAG
jgi:hypothetical protein